MPVFGPSYYLPVLGNTQRRDASTPPAARPPRPRPTSQSTPLAAACLPHLHPLLFVAATQPPLLAPLACLTWPGRRCHHPPPLPLPAAPSPPWLPSPARCGGCLHSPLTLRPSPRSSLWHKLPPLLQLLSGRRHGRLPVPPPSAIGAQLPRCCPAAPGAARPTGRQLLPPPPPTPSHVLRPRQPQPAPSPAGCCDAPPPPVASPAPAASC